MNEEEFIQMDEGGVGDWWYDARRIMLERELSSTPLKSGAKILDLAAACGGNFDICSQYGKVIGLDISWSSIEYCKKNKNVTLVQANAEILPFAKESIDIVVALDVLEHLEDDSCSMREIQRILKKDTGKLIFNTPAFMALFSGHDIAFHHYRRYQTSDLRKKLEAAKLRIDFITYWSFFIFPLVFIFRKLEDFFQKPREQAQSNFHLKMPRFVESILRFLSKIELKLIKRKTFFPFGVSIFGVASKVS